MLSIEPVERSSITCTSSPRSSSRSAKCEPTKPAPPVIKTFIPFIPRLLVGLSDRLRLVWRHNLGAETCQLYIHSLEISEKPLFGHPDRYKSARLLSHFAAQPRMLDQKP